MSDVKSIGQIGYEGYYNHTAGKSLVSGQNLPTWDQLPPPIREAWAASAAAIAAQLTADVEADADYGPAIEALEKLVKSGAPVEDKPSDEPAAT